jgi:hypothetical protein
MAKHINFKYWSYAFRPSENKVKPSHSTLSDDPPVAIGSGDAIATNQKTEPSLEIPSQVQDSQPFKPAGNLE